MITKTTEDLINFNADVQYGNIPRTYSNLPKRFVANFLVHCMIGFLFCYIALPMIVYEIIAIEKE